MKILNFTPNTRHEATLIQVIAKRATGLLPNVSIMQVAMDVSAVHLNGCPLRLEELAEAENFHFAHDVVGILRHLDRETGQLRDCFVPRYAVPR